MNYTQNIALLLYLGFVSCSTYSTSTDHCTEDLRKEVVEKEVDIVFGNTCNLLEGHKELNSDVESKEFLKICQTFYDEVCLGQASPGAILNNEGVYILDLITYQNKLRSLSIFTESFIQKQDEVFSECKMVLLKDSITLEKAPEGIDINAPSECSFFNYAYYFQAQEYPDGFYLKEVKIDGESGFTEMHYFTNTDDTYFTWDNQIFLNVELKKINNSWMINDVQKIIPYY